MSPTVRFKVPFGGRASPPLKPEPTPPPVSRIARQLALGHHIERLVETGVVRDYADAARRLGITRARVTQVVGLTLLSPAIQERILVGELRVAERELREVVAEVWARQEVVLTSRSSC